MIEAVLWRPGWPPRGLMNGLRDRAAVESHQLIALIQLDRHPNPAHSLRVGVGKKKMANFHSPGDWLFRLPARNARFRGSFGFQVPVASDKKSGLRSGCHREKDWRCIESPAPERFIATPKTSTVYRQQDWPTLNGRWTIEDDVKRASADGRSGIEKKPETLVFFDCSGSVSISG